MTIRLSTPFSTLPKSPSRPPRCAIIDSFSPDKPRLDINGDGIRDVPHGVVIDRLVHRLLPCETVCLDDPTIVVPGQLIVRKMAEIRERVANGEQIDAVNISSGFSHSFRMLRIRVNPDITPDNVHQYREEIRQWILDSKIVRTDEVIRAIESVTSLGIPVYLAAENQGPEYVNLFGFARGAIIVGSLNAEGRLSTSTAENSMITYARGVFGVSQQPGGYSLTGSGVDFKFSEAPLQADPWVFQIAGKAVAEAVTRDPLDYQLKCTHDANPGGSQLSKEHPVRKQIFSVQQLAEMGNISTGLYKRLQENHFEFVSFDNRHYFTRDAQNRLRYDPDASHRPDLVSVICGTSFASPVRMVEDLQRRRVLAQQSLNP